MEGKLLLGHAQQVVVPGDGRRIDSGVRGLTGSYPEWKTGRLPAAVGGSVRESNDSTRHLTHQPS